MKYYIGGIIQGSRKDTSVEPQDYRESISQSIKSVDSTAVITSPFDVTIPKQENRSRKEILHYYNEFFTLIENADIFIGYFPEASNGTAVELYYAFKSSTYTISISPMFDNWTLKAFSEHLVSNITDIKPILHTYLQSK